MFKKNILKYNGNKLVEVGLFHSGESGIAQTGDGGDFGDKWWFVNNALVTWLTTVLKHGLILFNNSI